MPAKRKYPYVTSYPDRHGKRRWRVVKDGRRAELGTVFGGEEFEARYAGFLAAEPAPVERKAPGTFGALIVAFKAGREWGKYTQGTRTNYLRFFDALAPLDALPCGDRWFQTKHAQAFLDRIPTDGARHSAKKRLGVLMRFAMRQGLRNTDPVAATATGYESGDGIAPWTHEQVAAALSAHPLDTPMGLALRLLYETGAALADVVRLGPQHLQGNTITYRRKKLTRRNAPAAVCPISDELRVVLASISAPTFLHVGGKQRSAAGLGNKVRAAALALGFQGSAHGIRKARANDLISAGANIQGVAAILGHSEVRTTAHYTRAADRRAIAEAAAKRLTTTDRQD